MARLRLRLCAAMRLGLGKKAKAVPWAGVAVVCLAGQLLSLVAVRRYRSALEDLGAELEGERERADEGKGRGRGEERRGKERQEGERKKRITRERKGRE